MVKPLATISRKSQTDLRRLKARVDELEHTLQAIQGGEVDALVMSGPDGINVYTLQGAEHPYRVMVESIREGAATLDTDGNVLYANGRLAELLGIPLEGLIGATLQDHAPSREWPRLQSLIERGRRHAATCELSIGEITGTRRVLRISFSPFRGPDLELICAVVTEVTELVEATEAQQDSERKLQLLSGRLLKLQDEERRHISRDLHDVSGQNLAALNLALSQLENSCCSWPSQESVKLLGQCAAALRAGIAGDSHPLVRFASPLLEEVGLASAIRWYANGFGQRTGIEVRIDAASNLVRLSQDAEIALFRVLQESLTNVHRYSETSTVEIRLGVQKDCVQLEIEDKGKGIPGDVLAARGNAALLGVGIQGMRERMRQLSGHLEIKSPPGEGTRVIAAVPVSGHEHETAVFPPDDGSEAQTEAGEREPSIAKRVLIADDHEMLREGIRRVLRNDKDWTVCGEASNGKEAVEKTKALDPDVVILDLSMPVLNGLDALRQIRQARPETKVLVFTVNNSDHVVREIVTAGADGYSVQIQRRAGSAPDAERPVRVRGQLARLGGIITRLPHRAARC